VHNNFYFLRLISSSLSKVLVGTVISECYSQSKDEIIFRFETHGRSFYTKASLSPSLSTLSFPAVVERAKKNSVDLFPGTIGYRVLGVRQYDNERSFSLELEEKKLLLFKMHGNRSNVILFEDGQADELFRNNLPGDAEINPDTLDRQIDWSSGNFLNRHTEPEKLYFTFGKVVWLYLREKGFYESSGDQQWTMIREVLEQLEKPEFYLTPIKNSIHLTLLPFGNSRKVEGDPIQAANRFFFAFTQEFVLEKEKQNAISILKSKLSSGLNYYEKNFQKLSEVEGDTNYKHWADLIMANMHQIKQGTEKVSLPDFYQDSHLIDIKLKKDIPPQANAAIYYRKAKNQHIEIEKLQQSLVIKEKEMETLRQTIAELESINDLKELRRKTQASSITSERDSQVQPLPYHEFVASGFRIWVGKNAHGNDELTLKHSYKEDLWLHAKDVAGSHVIIKHQSGKKFPKDVIERAAELAAYNSKRKTETLCPVIVTPRKFVRKRKGDPPGAVVIEREDVILVRPNL
jgi:predicted ribosome quality control (RQC) complex YloA/Tae2 family protein